MTDLRAPLIALVLVALGAGLLRSLPLAWGCLGVLAGLVAWRGPGLRATLARLAHVEGFLLVLLILLPWTVPGAPLWAGTSVEGLSLAALIIARVNIVALTLVLLPMAPQRIGQALAALGAPVRFVQIIELLLRHGVTVRQGWQAQALAMRARGYQPGFGPRAWAVHGQLLGGALSRALLRAERVEQAMRLRGGGAVAHAPLPPMPWRDRLACLGLAVVVAAGVALDRLV